MRSNEIFDANEDLEETRRTRRRRLFRYGVPLASVLLMMAGLVGIAFYSYQSNRDDTLALSRDLLNVLDQQVRLEVAAHFKPADNAVRALAAAAQPNPLGPTNRETLEHLGIRLLRDAPMVALISIADPQGNYLMLRPNEVGGIDSKLMERRDGQLTTTWLRRNAEGAVTSTEQDPEDTFDPRTRPWFISAMEAKDVIWTDAYVFFTDKKPGITAALTARDADGQPIAIIGVDIYLDDLSKFLADLRISPRSESMIVDEEGRVIAQRRQTELASTEGGELRLARVSELNRPFVTEIYDRIRVSGPNRSMAEIDRTPYIILGSSLADIITRDWMLIFIVPESDFVGFVEQNTRNSLIMSAAVVALALFIVTLLIRQGMATERTTRAMLARERDVARRESAVAELGALAGETETDAKQVARFTEAVARAVKAASVRVWRFEMNQSTAFCLDSYDAEAGSHTSGIELSREQIPALIQTMSQGQEVVIDNIAEDSRLAGVRNFYPPNAQGRNLLLFPLVQNDVVVGYLSLEQVPLDESTADATLSLLRSFARWLGAHLPGEDKLTGPAGQSASASRSAVIPPPHRLDIGPQALRSASLLEERQRLALRKFGDNQKTGSAAIYPQVTSLTLRLDLNAALVSDGAAFEDMMQAVAETARASCDQNGVRYLKIVANEIFAADGFEGDPEAAAANLANVALELRDHCTRLSRRHNRPPIFTMGIDSGPVVGTPIGNDRDIYNVWGEAVQLSQALAATAAPGTIQVSQTTYESLNSDFLFRRVGAYYLDRIGEIATFTLRGRL